MFDPLYDKEYQKNKKEFFEKNDAEEAIMNTFFRDAPQIALGGKKDVIKAIAEMAVELYENQGGFDDKEL